MPGPKKEINKLKQILSVTKGFPSIAKISSVFSLIFYILWTFIGLFILLVIIQGIRQGAYNGLLGVKQKPQAAEVQDQTPTAPEEVDLEGVGRVNVACVRQVLSSQSLQKLIESKDKSFLQGDEKDKFEKCIVATPQSPTPSPDKS